MEWVRKHGLISVLITLLGINAIFILIARDDVKDLEHEMSLMPKRILNEWKAYLFDKEMKKLGVKRDTTECNIDLHK